MSDTLIRRMKEKGMTQQRLSEITGISQPYISQIIGGRKVPTLETFYTLCKTLDVDPAELDDDEAIHLVPGFTGEELSLLFYYRGMDEENKRFIYRMAGMLRFNRDKSKSEMKKE